MHDLTAETEGLPGLPAWGVAKGVGSHLKFEFGPPKAQIGPKPHGAWHMWICGVPWELTRAGECLRSADVVADHPMLAALDGDTIRSLDLTEAEFRVDFASGAVLACDLSDDPDEDIVIFRPKRPVLIIGYRGKIEIET